MREYRHYEIVDMDHPDWELVDLDSQKMWANTGHDIVKDQEGVLRWRRNPMMRWLCDQIDLNQMSVAHQNGVFNTEDFMKFYRDIGYSLSGFWDIWEDKEELGEVD